MNPKPDPRTLGERESVMLPEMTEKRAIQEVIAMMRIVSEAVLAERKACAEIARSLIHNPESNDEFYGGMDYAAEEIAKAIEGRGK